MIQQFLEMLSTLAHFLFFELAKGILVADWLTILQQCLFLFQPFLKVTGKSVKIPQVFAMTFNVVYFFIE